MKPFVGNSNRIVRIKNDALWSDIEIYAKVYDIDTQTVFNCYCEVILCGHMPFTKKFSDELCELIHSIKYAN